MTQAHGMDREEDPLSNMVQIIEELLLAASRGRGTWRVSADAVDKTYDRLVDRIVDGSPPRDLHSWALRVLMNHLKVGPDRTELQSKRMHELPPRPIAADPHDKRASLPILRRRLEQIKEAASRILTDAEQAALQAMLEQPTMRDAASASDMTDRDLRARRQRIIKKLRTLARDGPGVSAEDASDELGAR